MTDFYELTARVQRTLSEPLLTDIMPEPAIETLHMPIDVQWFFLQHLSTERAKSFPLQLRAFVDRIYPAIPTLWVATSSITRIRFDRWVVLSSSEVARQATAELFGMQQVGVRSHEDIFLKQDMSSFDDKMILFLSLKYPNLKNILVTGMCTPNCVLGAIMGARQYNYGCGGLYDLMANYRYMPGEENPLAHKELLDKKLKDLRQSGYHLINSKTFITNHLMRPAARPLQAGESETPRFD